MKNILVIGSINMDLTVFTDVIPKLGETVSGKSFSSQGGGKGANQAIAVAKLGGNVKFLGAVGNDENGKNLLGNLKSNNVDFCGRVVENIPSGTAVITVCGGDNCIIITSGANECVTPELVEENEQLFDEADYVILQFEIPVETIIKSAMLAKAHNCKVVVNPAPYIDMPKDFYSHIDILVPNEHEAYEMTGVKIDNRESCIEAIDRIKHLGVGNVIITLGENGCAYTVGDEVLFHDARSVISVDSTAAGDTFIGAVCRCLSKNMSMEEAIGFATVASSITVSRAGASCSIPYENEVEEIYKS